jgi:uncharacterized protein (DUF1810 family)
MTASAASPASLDRFLEAQAPVYAQVRSELAAGAKYTHWMWFVFPQLRGLGRSGTARFFGIESRAEAIAYWRHPVLGSRLKECAELMLSAPPGLTALEILGTPDELKLRSCMTLFAEVAPEETVFDRVLARYYAGARDPATLALLGAR